MKNYNWNQLKDIDRNTKSSDKGVIQNTKGKFTDEKVNEAMRRVLLELIEIIENR